MIVPFEVALVEGDTLPGDGERGLKLRADQRLLMALLTRSPVTGSED